METVNLEFVFGTEKSFSKFRENFGKLNVHGYRLKQEEEYYYLDSPVSSLADESVSQGGGLQADSEANTPSGKRKSLRLSRHLQLSPVKVSCREFKPLL